MTTALDVVRGYHNAWTSKRFAEAGAFLSPDIDIEVPINRYDSAGAFLAAVESFGGLTTSVDLLAEFGSDSEAMLLYDMEVDGLGPLRVAEHFTVAGGSIVRIRQIHDTAPLRAASL